jgi:hypothetical protein
VSIGDLAYPYRANRGYGVVSFTMLFLVLLGEIEVLILLALAAVGRPEFFLPLQPIVIPAAVMVSLTAALVFAWRARGWTRKRVEGVVQYSTESSAYAERLAKQHHRTQG